jgi:putative ABC transport system permease protein
MLRYIPLMIKNTLRNRRRSLLTIGSIAVSLCLLGVLMAMYSALFLGGETTPARALRVVTRHKVSLTQALPVSYEGRIKHVPGVREVAEWQWFGGTYKDNRDRKNFFARFATEPKEYLAVRPEIEMPDDQRRAFERERTGCIVSRALSEKFNWKIGDRIPLQGDIFPVNLELTIVGIYDEPDHEESLYFNREYLRESLPVGSPRRDQAGAFLVQTDGPEAVPRVAKAIDALFDNSPFPTVTESERAFQLSFASFIGNIKLFLMAICGAVTFTILLVSGNTISMSVRERIREVGILKTLGFTREAILGIILGESVFISLVGGAIGLILAAGLCSLVRHAPAFVQALKTLTLTPPVALLSLALAIVIGLFSSLIPAWNAAKTSILDSLKDAG